MTRTARLHGVYPVFNTLFDDDGRIDLGALESELTWLLSWQVDGVVMGMVSEVLRLSEPERIDVARVACDVANQAGVDSIISVGAESTRVAVDLACEVEGLGASALMAIPPVAVALPENEITAYYVAILGATTIPLVIQDASGYVGRPLSIALQKDLLDRYGERVLFKPEAVPIGPRLTALRDGTGGRARIFEGTGGIALIDSFRRGIVGTMPGTDLIWALVALWRLLEQGEYSNAYEIAGPLVNLLNVQATLDSFVVVQKHLLRLQGAITRSTSRGPMSFELDDETAAEVERLFEQLRRKCEQITGSDPLTRVAAARPARTAVEA